MARCGGVEGQASLPLKGDAVVSACFSWFTTNQICERYKPMRANFNDILNVIQHRNRVSQIMLQSDTFILYIVLFVSQKSCFFTSVLQEEAL